MVKKIRLELINSMTPLITKNIKFKKMILFLNKILQEVVHIYY